MFADYRSGETIIESCIVIAIICLVFMGFFQLSQFYVAQEILHYASGRVARAQTVGFNDFMIRKVMRIATIANAGGMLVPEPPGNPAEQRNIERGRIPLYLLEGNPGRVSGILDYEDWDRIGYAFSGSFEDAAVLKTEVYQAFPIRFFSKVFHAFYDKDYIPMRGKAYMENHWQLYLNP
jgi:hypothetical protein